MKQVFYSEKLKTYFDSAEECAAAEKAFDRKQKALREKDVAKSQRAADAKVVEAARDKVIKAKQTAEEVVKKANKMIEEAEKEYFAARRAFINKYGSFHMTVSDEDADEDLTIAGIIAAISELMRLSSEDEE